MTRRLSGIAFWILLGLLIVANAIVMWHSLTVLRFWEDEAFNLTVPRNLVAGLGYASDGALSGSTLTPFDPRISTGPVVLLPVAGVLALGADPVIGARLVPLAYWVLLLIGLGVLGRRLSGRYGALIAVALPLAFNTADSVSPIQGPADLLGEIAAAALIVWALIVLPRRAWLAGLLLGLAVQAKLIALLALPAFAVALFLLTPTAPFRRRFGATLRRAILPLVLVAAPTMLMELIALVSLGFTGYARHVRALGGFLLSGGQHIEPTTVPQKLGTLAGSWFVPWWLAALAVLLAAVVVLWAALPGRRAEAGLGTLPRGSQGADALPQRQRPRWWERDPQLLALGFGSAVGLLAFVGWWSQAAQLPLWVRHPAVGVFAFAPILAAIAVRAVVALWRRHGTSGAPGLRRATALAAALALTAVVSGGAVGDTVRATQTPAETLAQQRAAVAPLAEWVRENDVEWLAAKPWGGPVSSVVLTGAHLGLFDAPAMRRTPTLGYGTCTTGSPLAAANGIVICPAP
ncbi:MAG: hypothetical protein LBE60_09940 [Microbacterium sp.]|jgi:hypothetical protein|uniref:hypothetical protein n=1 Tax=Microbacterium sp. TaxID=51671 RepID=UPI002834D8DD|nr:hypothetical protein [Microbacterium sp.]MDR2321954.1 hypothetical protein [Microbacterium sp.]